MTREEAIDRQAAIDVWKKDFKGFIDDLNMPRDDYKGIMAYIDEVPSVTPTQKSDSNALNALDCVDRQAVLDLLQMRYFGKDLYVAIHKLPSVTPEQKVVRCKDCKFVFKDDSYDNLWCDRVNDSFAVERDGFCAWGKMEEGE